MFHFQKRTRILHHIMTAFCWIAYFRAGIPVSGWFFWIKSIANCFTRCQGYIHTYYRNPCTLLFLIWCSHPQDSPSQPSFPVPSPAATLSELPLSASEYFHLLLSRVPLVSSFMVHRCHTCCSSLGHCAIPNSVSNLHIRIYEADLADRTMSATTIHQEDGDGKSSKDSSNC